MRRTFRLFLACGVFLLSPPVVPGGARAEEKTRIVPASGGAEVQEIELVRASSLIAVKGAQLTDMTLKLWFPADWKDKDLTHFFIRITSLDPIEDDTDKLLLTQAWRKEIECLRDEVRARESKR